MKKFGFTLAEVLITLGIIGVVAALTAPALTKNTGQAKIGPSLAKFVNTFEVASEQLLNDRNVDKLSSEASTSAKLGEDLASYIIMTPYKDTFTITAPNGSGSYTPNGAKYQLKDGSIAVFEYLGNISSARGAYKGVIGRVYYDINGNTQSGNKSGKDVFLFYIDNSGILIPAGSNADQYVFGLSSAFNGLKCNMSGTSYTAGLGCTGRIADNAWKADY